MKTCDWQLGISFMPSKGGVFMATECGHEWKGWPQDDIKYCPYCGGKIVIDDYYKRYAREVLQL